MNEEKNIEEININGKKNDESLIQNKIELKDYFSQLNENNENKEKKDSDEEDNDNYTRSKIKFS